MIQDHLKSFFEMVSFFFYFGYTIYLSRNKSFNSLAVRQACIELSTCNFSRIFCRWRFTVFTLMDKVSAISLLLFPSSINSNISFSRLESNPLHVSLSHSVIVPSTELITIQLKEESGEKPYRQRASQTLPLAWVAT